MKGAWHLTAPRPWLAEPMDPKNPDNGWKVTCPSKASDGTRFTIITFVSERDAKSIAASPIDPPQEGECSPPPQNRSRPP